MSKTTMDPDFQRLRSRDTASWVASPEYIIFVSEHLCRCSVYYSPCPGPGMRIEKASRVQANLPVTHAIENCVRPWGIT